MIRISKIVDDLIDLQRSYAFCYRVMVTEERYKSLIINGLIKDFSYSSDFIREPLIEHTGHLPIIAAHLYSEIGDSQKIDLGRVLIMLSIHDIGETEVGDVLTYAKTKKHSNSEFKAAQKILTPYLFDFFKEFEGCQTFDAKFAKSIDSIAPLLHELALPEIMSKRFEYSDFNVNKIIEKKEKHFTWDPTLKKIFAYIIKRYRVMENE